MKLHKQNVVKINEESQRNCNKPRKIPKTAKTYIQYY